MSQYRCICGYEPDIFKETRIPKEIADKLVEYSNLEITYEMLSKRRNEFTYSLGNNVSGIFSREFFIQPLVLMLRDEKPKKTIFLSLDYTSYYFTLDEATNFIIGELC